ncbi:MAG: hypothetical protein A3J54_00040 [Candidatus Ryanbacteria bacterium RIFCSPHIGHO2_02_FULL_45_13b]|uniref:Uncharacterized protein n=1 Tax=Candidatus Ryanbacteria bacterium RIFCSPHIGHO2_02_FULL_45_13b TaxID=1802117 RepID=A0A1G2G9I1_9BACT|nr:MAG: hypothetical protein A3J54_00040 [Candidatus Ryanbacteria bacterium RIFCSPHIGHO2_02_FULL_45_13b]
MIFAFTISFFSIVGIIGLLLRHVPQVARMTDEEIAGVLRQERPLLTQAWEYVLRVIQVTWNEYLREKTYAFIVKKVSHLRIIILRLEQTLFRFTARLRERTHTTKPPSAYWKDMHEWRKTTHWHKEDD